MRRLFGLFGVGIAVVGLASCGELTDPLEDGKLTVGMECGYAPYNFISDSSSDTAVKIASGQYCDGYDVMIASAIADDLDVELEIKALDWDGLISQVNDGRIDAIIAGMSPTAERKQQINFSNPYYTEDTELVVVVKTDSPYASATERGQLSGTELGYQTGTWQGDMYDQLENVTSIQLPSYESLITQTKDGRIDGYLAERSVAETQTAANQELTYISFEETDPFVLDDAYTSVAVGINKEFTDLLNDVNDALREIDSETRIAWMEKSIRLGGNGEE